MLCECWRSHLILDCRNRYCSGRPHACLIVMTEPTAPDEVRKYLATIGSKGGKQKTAKKMAQFAAAQAQGRQKMTPKRLAHLERARAARLAKKASQDK